MSEKTLAALDAHDILTRTIIEAVKVAGVAGLSAGDITAILNRIQELVDTED
jgi:hypothetical protein